MSEKVSIIMPLYNCAKFVEESIQSILEQTYSNWELIIVDDCSIDNGASIVKQYEDERICLIILKVNGGAAIARNIAIEKASGRYIAFLDADDLWHKEKLSKQISFMQQNQYFFTFTTYEKIIETGERTNEVVRAPDKLSYKEQLKYNHIGCLTVMYDSYRLGKVYMPKIRKRQDYALWLKILKGGITGHGLNENLSYYRLRNNSISSNKLEMLQWNWRLYRNVENLSIIKSVYYLCYNVYAKKFKKK